MRYLKVTILLGLLAGLIACGLHEAGAFERLDEGIRYLFAGAAAEPAYYVWLLYGVTGLLAFGIAWSTIDIGRWSLKTVVMAGALINLFSICWILAQFGIFISPFPPALAVLLAFIAGALYSRSEPGSRKRMLRLLLGDRISRRAFYKLLNAEEPVPLEGASREATVLVCEVFNHDELMDAMVVEDYVAMINRFLAAASDFLVERDAYLDECDGESLRVIFGAPVNDPEHAATACDAAIELGRKLDDLNREFQEQWQQQCDYKIGLSSGDMVTAAFGSHRIGSFSIAGEPVETARRLCAANLQYGSRILIGSGTFAAAGDRVEVRPLDLMRGRHEREREEVYELLGRAGELPEEALQRRDYFWKGVIYFREQRWDDALDHFQAAKPAGGGDEPVNYYLDRIRQARTGAERRAEWRAKRF